MGTAQHCQIAHIIARQQQNGKLWRHHRGGAFIFAGSCGYPESGKTALLDWRQIAFIGPLQAFKVSIQRMG